MKPLEQLEIEQVLSCGAKLTQESARRAKAEWCWSYPAPDGQGTFTVKVSYTPDQLNPAASAAQPWRWR